MSFFSELKRRNVFRVGIAYVVVAWLILQIADVILGNIDAPGWVFQVILLLLSIGFPVILLFAWAFELTPEGIKREKEVDRTQAITTQTGQKLNRIIIATLLIAVAYFAVDKFVLTKAPDSKGPMTAQVTAEPQAASPSKASIAILPFTNRSANNENAEFFALGIQDELLTLLSQIGELKVISRTSVERLDPNLSIPEIGALLGVSTILEGQVQRAGDQLRINVQLIDASKEDHLWASIYDRSLTAGNVFKIQSDMARAIADALHIQLSPKDEALIQTVPTQNTAALNKYMLGREQLGRGSFGSLDKAMTYFKNAAELDPNYAQAWAAIAETANRMLQTGSIDEAHYFSIAEGAVNNAIRLNSRLPSAHAQLGTLRWHSGDMPAAEAAYQKALQLNPRDAPSLLAFGRYLRTLLGLAETAVRVRVDPALVVRGDADQVGPEHPRHVLDLAARRLRVVDLDPLIRARPVRRERIEKALAPVLLLLELGEDVGEMPRGVAQGVVALPEALDLLPLLERRPVRLEEEIGALRADARVPEGARVDVVLLAEALEALEHLEAGLGVGARGVDAGIRAGATGIDGGLRIGAHRRVAGPGRRHRRGGRSELTRRAPRACGGTAPGPAGSRGPARPTRAPRSSRGEREGRRRRGSSLRGSPSGSASASR